MGKKTKVKNNINYPTLEYIENTNIISYSMLGSTIHIVLLEQEDIRKRSYDIFKGNEKAGIYIATLETPIGYKPMLYVGETSNIASRTRQHENDKLHFLENASKMIYIYSIDDLFKCSENRRCIERKLAILENNIKHQNISHTINIEPYNARATQRAFEDIFDILKMTFYTIDIPRELTAEKAWELREIVLPPMEKGKTYRKIIDGQVYATICYNEDETYLLKKKSNYSENISNNMDENHRLPIERYRNELIKQKAFKNGQVKKDIVFDAPYPLCCQLYGVSANATNEKNWYDDNGIEYTFPSPKLDKIKSNKNQYAIA